MNAVRLSSRPEVEEALLANHLREVPGPVCRLPEELVREGKRIRERLDQAERLYWLLYRAGMDNQDCARRFGVSAREVRRWRSWLRRGL